MQGNIPLYQVGGYRAHTNRDAKTLADILCPSNGGVDLLLGILPCGASYLLLEERPFFRIFRNTRDRPWHSFEFRSLSPIHFDSRETFEAKLDTFVSNKNKKGGQSRDRSKLNKAYTSTDLQFLSPEGKTRAEFELHRVLYRLRRSHLPPQEVFTLPRAIRSRIDTLRLISLSYTLWEKDGRRLDERIRDPKIKDIGWTEFTLPDASNDLRVKSAYHWVIDENKMFFNPGRKRVDFQHGATDTISQVNLATRLQALLSDISPNFMLLVHDQKETLQILSALGVNGPWQDSLHDILGPQKSSSDSRRRSRSPQHDTARDPRQRARSPSSQSPTTQPFIVDLKASFSALKQVYSNVDLTIPKICHDLLLKSNGPNEQCAGNDSVVLGSIWEAMVSGNAIDDQRLARWPNGKLPSVALADEDPTDIKVDPSLEALPAAVDDDDDSDFDPNDVEPVGNQGGVVVEGVIRQPGTANAAPAKDPYEELEDDDDY
ncbi:hypothetical protein EIP91_000840 [Steccherinum ochraceum]|uniref:Uncharacterized protein n=1 Tax=Steccherinum ochraceum TaxID=92696 RepID=A0A4R0S307_9APHY|nr:hypothetical protein EIP91_000840 [Steccherinum ochraceum]